MIDQLDDPLRVPGRILGTLRGKEHEAPMPIFIALDEARKSDPLHLFEVLAALAGAVQNTTSGHRLLAS